ncbi:MAG: F0F1 ATP synthase subunit A [Methylobacteriaceae bacterium]|nr:F0F1 ATP synthase subunit A [Methylobacteriaceae bacterium]MBV9219587.1 F0F1 ATP synthase subunit A [Methylobacteriaceae bacterium]MBV9243339.1 F0F1 ATP synthase subunit A [Methylobacteriaceae bacterium]MBV9637023.1 F0F1 ATP synthase subunit A [Methylobacteriaceae bacterium]
MNPIEQFQITKLVSLHLFGYDVSFTNSSLFMVIALALIVLVMIAGSRPRALVPGRLQSIAEVSHEFVAGMVRQTAGEAGMRFFPFVFSLFMFIFFANVLGLIPYAFTVTSHLIITVTMALMVFLTVIFVGFAKNGLHFLRLFVPPGVPWWILPFVVPIEVISFFTRPVSHSIRLFANMLAGHITLQVFAGFVLLLLGGGVWALLSPFPFLFTVAVLALELLVAFLQAYVFAMLTCLYLNDALHPGQH